MKESSAGPRTNIRRARHAATFLSVAAIAAVMGAGFAASGFPGLAWAESHEDGGHSDGDGHDSGAKGQGAGGSGGSGGHEDGHEEGDHEDGHEPGGPGGAGGDHEDGDHEDGGGKGPAAGGDGEGRGGQAGGQGSAGGKPVWAQEGIPEVELGRLNVARSPDQVLGRAFSEALASFTPDVAAFYRLDLAAMEKELSENWGNVRLIDSPLQNLALMRDALDGSSVLATVGITTDNDTLLAAFLGTASDKSIPVTAETAAAISTILGQPLSPSEAAALAEKAEKIRQAILEGHG